MSRRGAGRGQGARPLACSYEGCEKRFSHQSKLKMHIRTHPGERPFACKFAGCSKSFGDPSTLTAHMRVHTGEKPFPCKWQGCPKRFAHSGNLNAHMRSHTGEKPFKCTHPGCNARFSDASALPRHRRTHTGERPYACTHPGCVRKYASSSHLTKHARTHTGVKPFICKHRGCKKVFADNASLKRHAYIHSGDKPFACTEPGCDKKFTHSSNLNRHFRTKHKGSAAKRRTPAKPSSAAETPEQPEEPEEPVVDRMESAQKRPHHAVSMYEPAPRSQPSRSFAGRARAGPDKKLKIRHEDFEDDVVMDGTQRATCVPCTDYVPQLGKLEYERVAVRRRISDDELRRAREYRERAMTVESLLNWSAMQDSPIGRGLPIDAYRYRMRVGSLDGGHPPGPPRSLQESLHGAHGYGYGRPPSPPTYKIPKREPPRSMAPKVPSNPREPMALDISEISDEIFGDFAFDWSDMVIPA